MDKRRSAHTPRAACGTASLVVAAILGLASGCANRHGQAVAFLRAHEDALSTAQYTVMPPDAIRIHSPVAPEIDGVVAQVRPDGKVALRLVGEVDVAGLTPEQIAEKVCRQLARFYSNPEVVIDVAHYESQFYYVFGQVASAGRKPFTGRDTLLAALAEAQPTFLAWRSQIRVVRPAPDESGRKIITVDLDHMVTSGEVAQNILLQPGDIIEVPPTPLAWLGLHIREVLYPVEPLARAYDQPADMIGSTHVYQDEFSPGADRYPRRYR